MENKKINLERINFLLNVLSFIAGIIFYIRVGHTFHRPESLPESTAIADSILVNDVRLKMNLQAVQEQQQILLSEIKLTQDKLKIQDQAIENARQEIMHTILSDWDTLSQQQQEDYADELIRQMRNNQPP